MMAVPPSSCRVLVLGSGLFQIPLIERLLQQGHEVLVAGPTPPHVTVGLPFQFRTADLLDISTLTRLAVEYGADVALSTASEIGALGAALVNSNLGLSGARTTYIDWGLDKSALRQTLDILQLPNISYQLIQTEVELARCETLPGFGKSRFIVKPRSSWGSRGVMLIETPEELNKAYAEAAGCAFSRPGVLVEPYLESPEFGGNAYFVEGAIRLLAITEKSLCKNLQVRGHWYEPSKKYYFEEPLRHILSALGRHVGFESGIINFDVRCSSSQEPVLLDIGFRDGGNGLGLLVKTPSKHDSIDALVSYALDEAPSWISYGIDSRDVGFSLVGFSQGEHDQILGLLREMELTTETTILSSTSVSSERRTPTVCFITHGEKEILRNAYDTAINLLSP